jgi:hypothetical protein
VEPRADEFLIDLLVTIMMMHVMHAMRIINATLNTKEEEVE